MQAILVADYSFTPLEYWRGVSQTARDFIKRCLTTDPRKRMTSHQALQHPWIRSADQASPADQLGSGEDLLPTVKKNFNARRTLHKAIDTVRAINKLREAGGLMMMDGAMSVDPKPKAERVDGSKVVSEGGGDGGGARGADLHHDDVDAMEVDSRSNGRGQTDDQIQDQQRKIQETVTGLWKR